MATVFLTGQNGYLGACAAALLRRAGHEVAVPPARLEDLAPRSVDADYVVHLAALRRHRQGDILAANVEGARRLLAALRGAPRLIYASSRAVFGERAPGAVLDDAAAPAAPDTLDAYGASKLLCEFLIEEKAAAWVTLRLTSLVGVGMDNAASNGVLTRMIAHGLEHGTIPAFGRHSVDPIHVQDLARCVVRLCTPGPHWNRRYNAAGPFLPLERVAAQACAAVRRATGRSCRVDALPGDPPTWPLLDAAGLRAAGFLEHAMSLEATCDELARLLAA